jgi:hypothetical protein
MLERVGQCYDANKNQSVTMIENIDTVISPRAERVAESIGSRLPPNHRNFPSQLHLKKSSSSELTAVSSDTKMLAGVIRHDGCSIGMPP